MNRIIIAKSNLKKKKVDMLVVLLLVAITFVLFYISGSVIFNLDAVQERVNEQKNGADVVILSANPHQEEIISLLEAQPKVETVAAEAVLVLYGSSYYRGDEVSEDSKLDFILGSIDWEGELSQLLLTDEDNKSVPPDRSQMKDDAIVLPYYLKTAEGYQVGDGFTIKMGEQSYSFEVAGFTEAIFFSVPSVVPMFKGYITAARMAELRAQAIGVDGNIYMYTVKAGESIQQVDDEIKPLLDESIADWQQGNNMVLEKERMKMGSAIYVYILMAIVSVFALMLLIIAVFVIRFSLNNSLEMNLKNIGMFQANGYTAGQLSRITIGEIL
ncbi:MAG: hypothetical protein LBV33_04140, partial [Lachnospiraceae bacterium]|nr:hypothetical protein [Lachnospiraceae bacterium]